VRGGSMRTTVAVAAGSGSAAGGVDAVTEAIECVQKTPRVSWTPK
jgi:hypothetical protein